MPLDVTYHRPAINEKLKEEGYLHATNLPVRSTNAQSPKFIKADPKFFGTWNAANGKSFIATQDGEVWIAYKETPSPELVEALCPRGKSEMSFLLGGEMFEPDGFLARHKDPYYGIDESGKYDHSCPWPPFPKP